MEAPHEEFRTDPMYVQMAEDIRDARMALKDREGDLVTKPHTWTDERTGRSFLIHKTRDEKGTTFRLERNTDTHETLGHVRVEKEAGANTPRIWAVASTVPDGKAEREYVTAVEDGFKILTAGA